MDNESRAAEFTVIPDGEITVVMAKGELDLAVRDELRRVLTPLTGQVAVDLGGVSFIDSSCVGVLAGEATRLRSNGGDLRLRAPSSAARIVLDMTGLGDWVESG